MKDIKQLKINAQSDNTVIYPDIGKILTEIGSVSGTGDKRIGQIMEIIRRNTAIADSKGKQYNE